MHPYTQLPTLTLPQEMDTIPLDDFYTVLELWSDIKNTYLFGTLSKSRQILHIHEENIQKHHVAVLKFLFFFFFFFLYRVTLEPLNEKTKVPHFLCEALLVCACE